MAILYEKAEIIQSISMVSSLNLKNFSRDRSFISPEMWEKSLNKYSVFHLTKPDDRIKCQTLNFED